MNRMLGKRGAWLSAAAALIGALLAVTGAFDPTPRESPPVRAPGTSNGADTIERAVAQRARNAQVRGSGEVERILADDRDGSRHQRFIVRLDSGGTVLVAHNIDLAPRVESLDVGDTVSFAGEYEWNERGGVLHWTHRDPRGSHAAGYIEHEGRTYR
ncbi:MAG TPA: DUF3465 domain-containing protein [Candidatus Saccharimonadia bacterium]|nr:DUF3465 domain-containing protein [Candidatus Saccharimonadia bacterium]